jgi:Family of unknown function (DUF6093)
MPLSTRGLTNFLNKQMVTVVSVTRDLSRSDNFFNRLTGTYAPDPDDTLVVSSSLSVLLLDHSDETFDAGGVKTERRQFYMWTKVDDPELNWGDAVEIIDHDDPAMLNMVFYVHEVAMQATLFAGRKYRVDTNIPRELA